MITLAEIKVKVKCPERDGYFLRWYFNGWHSFFFVAGGESYETKNEWWTTQSKSKVKFGTAFLTQNEIKSIRTMLFAKRVEVLLKDGWKAIVVDSTSLKIEDTRTRGYKCEFTAAIYAKVADYTPVKEVPIVEMDNVRITPEDDIRVTPEGDVRVVTSTEYDPIVSYIAFPTITRFIGEDVPLPNTATVTYKSGRVETLVVKWEVIKNDTAGAFKVYGDVASGGYAVVQEVVLIERDDLYWLRQIRDANPSSQLPSLWPDSEDPYTEWPKITWSGNKVSDLSLGSLGISNAAFINKLSDLRYLQISYNDLLNELVLTNKQKLTQVIGEWCSINIVDFRGSNNLARIDLHANKISSFLINTTNNIFELLIYSNNMYNVSFITSKLNISNYNFTHNYITTLELDRLRALGFTDESKLLPQKA